MRDDVCGVFIGDDNVLKRSCLVLIKGDGAGDLTRASMFIGALLPGDSSRSRSEDNFVKGVVWDCDCD